MSRFYLNLAREKMQSGKEQHAKDILNLVSMSVNAKMPSLDTDLALNAYKADIARQLGYGTYKIMIKDLEETYTRSIP